MILLIDNYDSFSYNLYQMIGELDPDICVIRNDAMTVDEIRALSPDAIILSPGPGRPENAGVCEQVVRELGADIPILGVCLGHQAICEAYGASIIHAARLMHGKPSMTGIDTSKELFKDMSPRIQAARYHSLAVDEATLPKELIVTARAEDGEVMAVQHEKFPVYGLQFHPESIMTPDGPKILANFLETAKACRHR